jgi:protein involved in polysaccharide export with SLBB domain
MNWNILKRALSVSCLLMTVWLLSGCASNPNDSLNPPKRAMVFPGEQPGNPSSEIATTGQPPVLPADPALQSDPSKLIVGDLLSISFSDVPAPGLQEIRTRIPSDGFITLHLNIRIKATGRTIAELQQEIRKAYVPSLFVNLTAVVKTEERFFYVGGEVRVPNRQLYLGNVTVLRAIETAGGFTDFADRKKIQLRRASGETLTINARKAEKDPTLDPQVLPNDHITIPRTRWGI